MIGTNKQLYENSMQSVGYSTSKLRRLYQELHDYYQKKSARAPSMISADIKKEKEKLGDYLSDSNIYFTGIIRERELDAFTCQGVFEFQNQMINQSIVNLLSLPEADN